ncbi:hypothetical protein HS088_TW21G00736 [Tripterygium wilfordii]|uniref:Senescence regulator n=1 Tax=Tripterygium wilfordii TaxID=458696 RepID=A0A7J7C399_TRIWF|nr:uncharacterized protein LOC119989618 [Tripterygium wilfordii]KAF5728588.1 hypothetical protein HS088_TW21G00736 [Tripterygium wilfordii]
MAKGRRLTASRSERLLGSSYSYNYTQGSIGGDESELGEEDVWSIVDEADRNEVVVNNSLSDWSPHVTSESNGSISPKCRRRISREGGHVGGLSLAFEDTCKTGSPRVVHKIRGHDSVASPRVGHHMATSAPVNVPDWSKIYRVDSVESLHYSDENNNNGMGERESEMVPPHEYLAREYARGWKPGGMSVFEGVGRTLKGRDLRRVRDAVWSQTGFDG